MAKLSKIETKIRVYVANCNHMGIIADQTQCFTILFEGAVILFLFQTVSLPDCEKISVFESFYSNHNLAPICANKLL